MTTGSSRRHPISREAEETDPAPTRQDRIPATVCSAAADVLGDGAGFIGQTVGDCRLLAPIAEGGTSFIFRAHNLSSGIDRVVKMLKPAHMREAAHVRNFAYEAEIAARLDHPNIPRAHNTGVHRGHPYIEMDLVRGRTVRDMIETRGRLHEREVLSIVRQVCDALDHMHGVHERPGSTSLCRGVIHRDIKPANIMVDTTGTATLIDFGSAMPVTRPTGALEERILGTLRYMSPEQIRGEYLNPQSDLFSLGTVMYEMITGRYPYGADSIGEMLHRIQEADCTPVRLVRRSVTPTTADLIEQLMRANRLFRSASARAAGLATGQCLRSVTTWPRSVLSRISSLARRVPAGSAGALALVLSAVAAAGRLVALAM